MAKYSVVHLDINGKDLMGVDNLRDVEKYNLLKYLKEQKQKEKQKKLEKKPKEN